MSDEIRARRDSARRSPDAWKQYCEQLSPGEEMDMAVHQCFWGPVQRKSIPKYSTEYGDAILVIDHMTWMDVSRNRSASGDHVNWEVTVEYEGDSHYYQGDGEARTMPEAVCRAVLNMYSPTE